jgi:hypothetical protein
MRKESILGKILPGAPIPTPFPIDVPLLLEIGKKVWGYVKKIMSEPEINEDSTVRDIESVNDALTRLRDQIYNDIEKQINDVKNNVGAYAKDIQFLVDEKKDFLDCYNVRYKSKYKDLDELENCIDRFCKEYIKNIFSLDNLECRTILMIPAGGRKEKELSAFIGRSKLQMFEELSKYIGGELNRISDFLLEDVCIAVTSVETRTVQFQKLCTDIECENTTDIERELCEADLKYWVCDKVSDYLEG